MIHSRFLVLLVMLGVPSTAILAGGGWGYDQAGLACWGGTCDNGWSQSPIDIRDEAVVDGNGPKLEFDYKDAEYVTYDSGYNVTYTAKSDAGTLRVGDKTYKLLQFHFHTASEHTVNGQVYPMEVHLVHKEEGADQLAVVGVLFQTGEANPMLDPIFAQLPATMERTPGKLSLNPTAFLPESKANFRYSGSLTTPPCSEIVAWHVMQTPQPISAEQIKKFTDVVPRSARPTQPLNRRKLTINQN